MTAKTDTPAALPARAPRPLHTRKSAWKLGWPITRPRLQEPARPEPAAG